MRPNRVLIDRWYDSVKSIQVGDPYHDVLASIENLSPQEMRCSLNTTHTRECSEMSSLILSCMLVCWVLVTDNFLLDKLLIGY